MIIPDGYAQVNVLFGGTACPRGAQVAFGVDNQLADLSATAVATAVGTIWTSRIMPGLSSSCQMQAVRAKLGPNDVGPFAEVSYAVNGGDAADAGGPQVALLTTKYTALGGRAQRGRMFLPGFNEENYNESGVVVAATVTAFNTRLANVLADLVTADIPMVLLHSSEDYAPTYVDSWLTSSRVASQRRRLRKVGGRRRTTT